RTVERAVRPEPGERKVVVPAAPAGDEDLAVRLQDEGLRALVAVAEIDRGQAVAGKRAVEPAVRKVAGEREHLAVAVVDSAGGDDAPVGLDVYGLEMASAAAREQRLHDASIAEAGVERAVQPVANEAEARGEAVRLAGEG